MRFGNPRIEGAVVLVLATAAWGLSFPAIKVVTSSIDGMTYTWVRGAIALMGLLPYVTYLALKRRLNKRIVYTGIMAGTTFAVGAWLQGWGTSLTTASNSAFITGMSVLFVHVYDAVVKKEPYGVRGATALILSLVGLYLLVGPVENVNIGDMIVLASAFAWAAQIELISKFSGQDPLAFVFFEMVPMLVFAVPSLYVGFSPQQVLYVLPQLAFLGLVCSDLALAAQVYGQRFLRAYEAAIVYLLEPVFAAVFSFWLLGELLSLKAYLGATLILVAIGLVTVRKIGRVQLISSGFSTSVMHSGGT